MDIEKLNIAIELTSKIKKLEDMLSKLERGSVCLVYASGEDGRGQKTEKLYLIIKDLTRQYNENQIQEYKKEFEDL